VRWWWQPGGCRGDQLIAAVAAGDHHFGLLDRPEDSVDDHLDGAAVFNSLGFWKL
jgi:hypothetical protein